MAKAVEIRMPQIRTEQTTMNAIETRSKKQPKLRGKTLKYFVHITASSKLQQWSKMNVESMISRDITCVYAPMRIDPQTKYLKPLLIFSFSSAVSKASG